MRAFLRSVPRRDRGGPTSRRHPPPPPPPPPPPRASASSGGAATTGDAGVRDAVRASSSLQWNEVPDSRSSSFGERGRTRRAARAQFFAARARPGDPDEGGRGRGARGASDSGVEPVPQRISSVECRRVDQGVRSRRMASDKARYLGGARHGRGTEWRSSWRTGAIRLLRGLLVALDPIAGADQEAVPRRWPAPRPRHSRHRGTDGRRAAHRQLRRRDIIFRPGGSPRASRRAHPTRERRDRSRDARGAGGYSWPSRDLCVEGRLCRDGGDRPTTRGSSTQRTRQHSR